MQIKENKYSDAEEFIYINDLDPDLIPIQFKLPDIPNDRDILNYHLTTANQKFIPTQYPERLVNLMRRIGQQVDNDNKKRGASKKKLVFYDEINRELFSNRDKYEDIFRFVMTEWERRLNGVWFFNNGVRTHIPGNFYTWLNYWTIPEGKPIYKDVNRRYFYFQNETMKDPNCYGMLEMTQRKNGKSIRGACVQYNIMTMPFHRYAHGGIQSKNDTDAKDLFKKLVLGWKGFPFFFQPVHNHLNAEPQNELKFSWDSGQSAQELESGNRIDFRPAKASAYDSTFLLFYISDEEGKLEAVDAYDRWNTVKPALVNHLGIITGKSLHTTTVEDNGIYGFDKFKELWDDSDYHKRDDRGQSKSGLWRIFFPAFDGLEIDDYGMSDLKKAKRILDMERKAAAGNTKMYNGLLRKKPYNTRECFTISSENCPFNKELLEKRLSFFFSSNPYLIKGDYIWKNNTTDGEVEFVQHDKGRFEVSWMPPPPLRNKVDMISRRKFPGNRLDLTAGGDTFNYDKTEGIGSNGGGAVYHSYNPVIEKPLWDAFDPEMSEEEKNALYAMYKTNRFVCTYDFRPPTKEEYVEDMIKMCMFNGCYMYPELNFDHIQTGFKKRGYGGYLLHDHDEKKMRQKDNSGVVTNTDSKDKLFSHSSNHILENINYEFHPSLITQWLRVSYDTMTDYDLFAASACALLGHHQNKHIIEREVQRRKMSAEMNKEGRRIWPEERTLL